MDSKEESGSEEVAKESEEESDSGVASLSLASAFVAKSILNIEENGHDIDNEISDDNDSAPTYCFMVKGAKVSSCAAYFDTLSEDDSECESKPS